MRWRATGVILLVLVYAGLWVIAAAGSPALIGPLVTLPVLVFLIAAGNWFQHWFGIKRRAPQFARPGTPESDGSDPPSS